MMRELSKIELARLYRKIKPELCNYDPDLYRFDIIDFEHRIKDKLEEIKNGIEKYGLKYFLRQFKKLKPEEKFIYYPHSFKSSDKVKNLNFFSNKKELQLQKLNNGILNVRKIFYAPIEIHILTAYWIENIGDILDRNFPKEVYGGRIKRDLVLNTCNESNKSGKMNIAFPGIFIPYYYKYSEWREKSLNAIINFNKRYDILVLTLDIVNFYPSINLNRCKKLVEEKLKKEFNKNVKLKELNDILFALINHWNRVCNSRGLPIGLLASPILANLYMEEFDEFIKKEFKPLFYGRYIDDVILVLNAEVYDIEDLINIKDILNRPPQLKQNENKNYVFNFKKAKGRKRIYLEISQEKQKNFFLSKDASPSLIKAVQREINEISSLRKFLPDFLDTDSKLMEKVFQIYAEGDFGDNLRKIEQIRVRKLGMSVLLSKLREQARYLPPEEWKDERYKIYEDIQSLIFDPANFFENIKNILQLIQLMTYLKDDKKLICLIENIEEILKAINISRLEIEIKGIPSKKTSKKRKDTPYQIKKSLSNTIEELIIKSILLSSDEETFEKLINKHSESQILQRLRKNQKELKTKIKSLKNYNLEFREKVFHFLIKTDNIHLLKELLKESTWNSLKSGTLSKNKFFKKIFREIFQQILEEDEKADKFIRLLMFPSLRIPYIYLYSLLSSNITNSKTNDGDLRAFISILLLLGKGVFIKNLPFRTIIVSKPCPEERSSEDNSKWELKKLVISHKKEKTKVRLGISNFILDESYIKAILKREKVNRKEKYRNLMKIINSSIGSRQHVDYIVLPELALPKDWLIFLSQELYNKKTSVITGGEYEITTDGKVINPVYSLLYTETKHTSFYILIKEEKIHIAPEEKKNIENLQLSLSETNKSKLIYQHGNFQFSNLICFDITDLKLRSLLRGKIDALFVVALNRDLDYFASIVEATSRDMHCYIVIVNSGKYGDSRIRAPYRENYLRDIVRIKGGKNSYLVIDEIDIKSLREFHSQLYYDKEALFKPHPPGFHEDIDDDRKTWNWKWKKGKYNKNS